MEIKNTYPNPTLFVDIPTIIAVGNNEEIWSKWSEKARWIISNQILSFDIHINALPVSKDNQNRDQGRTVFFFFNFNDPVRLAFSLLNLVSNRRISDASSCRSSTADFRLVYPTTISRLRRSYPSISSAGEWASIFLAKLSSQSQLASGDRVLNISSNLPPHPPKSVSPIASSATENASESVSCVRLRISTVTVAVARWRLYRASLCQTVRLICLTNQNRRRVGEN